MTGGRSSRSRAQVPADKPLPQHTLHGRIREELRERIVSGALKEHGQIPSESELMRAYGVSRITVRQALSDLERERLIFKIAGKGSFVSPATPFQELGRLQGFAEAMGAMGHETFNRVLALENVPAPERVAEQLALPVGTEVTAIRRVRYLDRKPVSLDLTWVPAHIGERLAREDLTRRDIFLVIENQCGIPLGHAGLVIRAETASAEVAAPLQLKPGAPILHIERLTSARDGTPLDYEQLYCRSDNFQYRLRLAREP